MCRMGRGKIDDGHPTPDFRRHFRAEHRQHLFPDGHRPVALFRLDAHHQPRPIAVLFRRRLHQLQPFCRHGKHVDRHVGGDGGSGPGQFRRGALRVPAHLRTGYHLHHDRLLRDSDRRRGRHQIHLGVGSPTGPHSDRNPGHHSGHGHPRLPADGHRASPSWFMSASGSF